MQSYPISSEGRVVDKKRSGKKCHGGLTESERASDDPIGDCDWKDDVRQLREGEL